MVYWMSSDPKTQLNKWLPQIPWATTNYAQQNFLWLQNKIQAPAIQSTPTPMQSVNPTPIQQPQAQSIQQTQHESSWISIPVNNFTGIAWVTAPTIWSQFGAPQWSEQTQVTNMPVQVQQSIKQEISAPIALPANTIPDLIASIQKHPEATAQDIQTYFPELKGNANTYPDLIASLKAHPDATESDIKTHFPELFQQTQQPINVEGKNPLLRGTEAIWWAISWGFVWAYQWLVPWFKPMVDKIKEIWADPSKWIAEKFNQSLLWEVMFNYIWGTIGDIVWWMIIWWAKWFTTESEQQRISEKAGKKISEFIDVAKTNPDVNMVIEAYNKLDPKEKQDLQDLTKYAINAANLIPVVWQIKYGVWESLKGTANVATNLVDKWAAFAATQSPESILGKMWTSFLQARVFWYLKNKWLDLTTENILDATKILYKQIYGTDLPWVWLVPAEWATVWVTPTQVESVTVGQSEWIIARAKDRIKAKKSELDPSTIRAVQSNPYVPTLRADTMANIESTWVPTDLNQLIKEPLAKLGTDLVEIIEGERARLSESWPLYQSIRQDTTPVDITPAQAEVQTILKNADISIGADNRLNFNNSALSTPADMTAIQKIFDRIMWTTNMNADSILNLRTFASDLTKWDQWWTTQGWYVVKQMRKAVDNVAKEQLIWLKELDAKYRQQLKDLEKVQEGIFYREARRRWELKDNFISILKNIGWQNRANMLARLEAIMPDLGARAEAINMIPKLAKIYTTPSKLSKTAGARVWWFAAWFWLWWRLWGIIWEKVVWIMGDHIFDGMKKNAIKNIVDKITPEAKAKLQEINAKIEAKKALTAQEKQEVIDLKNKIEKSNASNLQTAQDKAELAKQDKQFRDFLDQWDTKGMWLPETPWVKPVNTIVGWGKTIAVAPTWEAARAWQNMEIGKASEPSTTKGLKEAKASIETTKADNTAKVVKTTKSEAKWLKKNIKEWLKAKEEIKNTMDELADKKWLQDATQAELKKLATALQKSKGLSAEDIMKQYPDINLKREVTIKDVHWLKHKIDAWEALTPYQMKDNKVVLQDWQTYIVSKSTYDQVKQNAVSGEAKPFAPELKGTEETIKGWYDPFKGLSDEELMQQYEDMFDWYPTWLSMSEIKRALEKANNEDMGTAFNKEPSDTKYSQYTLPWWENYKEILIKTSDVWTIKELPEWSTFTTKMWVVTIRTKDGLAIWIGDSKSDATKKALEVINNVKWKSFKSSHREEPNVLAHLRLNERTYNWKKVTFMEELQSDWAREARKNVPQDKLQEWWSVEQHETELAGEKWFVRDANGKDIYSDVNKEQAIIWANNLKWNNIPSHPLLANRQELSIKRALQEAVANWSEYFSWINWEQTAARYSLEKHLDSIKREPFAWEESKYVEIKIKWWSNMNFWINKSSNIITRATNNDMVWKTLDDVIWKWLAEKIMTDNKWEISGEWLKIWGERAHNLYDKAVPNIVKSLTGKSPEMIDMGISVESKQLDIKLVKEYPSGTSRIPLESKDIRIWQLLEISWSDYFITENLGEGKFMAISRKNLDEYIWDRKVTHGKAIELGNKGILNELSKEFTISITKTTQQAIKLTPDVVAKIKGEAFLENKPSGLKPFLEAKPMVVEWLKPKGELAQKEWLPMNESKWLQIKSKDITNEMKDITPKTKAIIEWEFKKINAQVFMSKAGIELKKHNKKWTKAYYDPNDGNIYLQWKLMKQIDTPEIQYTLRHEIWHWIDESRSFWWRKGWGNLYASITKWDYSTEARAELQAFQDYIQSDREIKRDTVIHQWKNMEREEFLALPDTTPAMKKSVEKMYQAALRKRELVKEYLRQDIELFADGIAKYMKDPVKMRKENVFIANIFEHAIYSNPKVVNVIGKEWISNTLRRSLQAVNKYEFLVERIKKWSRSWNQYSDRWEKGELYNKDDFTLDTLKSYLERNAKWIWLKNKSEKRILWWNSMDNGDMIKLWIGTTR